MKMTDQSNLPTKAPIRSGAAVKAFIPETIDDAWRLANGLAESGGDMVPDAYRKKPGAIMLAMQKGAELGLAPLAALQTIAAINGRATLWGDALPGLIWKAGHKLEEWIVGEGDDMVAHCVLIRRDRTRIERTFSVQDAKTAGLWSKPGPWKQYPKRMLQMRARSFAVRDGASDVTMGLSVREEVDDFSHRGPDNAKDISPAAMSLQERVKRAKAEVETPETAQGAAEPPVESDVEEAEVVDAEADDASPTLSEEEAERIAAEVKAASDAAAAEDGDLFDGKG